MTFRTFVVMLAMFVFAVPLVSASAATTVTSSALDSIVIIPNDRPTVVDIGTDQQFLATGYTKEGQALTGLTITWTTDGDVGTITESGIFTATQGGIGRITARNGKVTASVGVVVHGVAAQKPAAKEVIPPSNTTVQPVTNTNASADTNANTNAATDQGEVKGATTGTTDATTGTSCTTIRAWLWLLILLLYCIVLFAYFLSLGESRTIWWWVWPAIITAAPAVLYFFTRCGTTHIWVPWTLGILAILLVLFYLRVLRPTESIPATPRQ